jgi:hypothetical protein
MPAPDLRALPHLHAYITRIGAEQLNFRRFIVKEYARGNYYRERSLITINADFTITCTNENYAPTDEEATAIKTELERANFPQPIQARSLDQLIEQENLHGAQLYALYSRVTGMIVMAQQRIDLDTGGKAYLPWTLFDDGIWRRMEPGGELPFWKPERRRDLNKIMVHEGAKAASFIDDLVNNPARRDELNNHPFREWLIQYEHWGIIGGALAPHRADYGELRREQPVDVIYVCDNDFEGRAVLPQFSRKYAGPLKGVQFTSQFPRSWDMADPIPANLMHNGRYTGFDLWEMMASATFATEQVGTGKNKYLKLTDYFKREWVHVVQPEMYINTQWPDRTWGVSEFNNMVNPFSHSDNTAAFVKRDNTSKRVFIAYTPVLPSGPCEINDVEHINTYVAPFIKSDNGDPQPWIDFLTYLIPAASDRHELMRWVATLIARPDIRMRYGVLAVSETQGVGKSTLGDILSVLIGKHNTSFPPEHEIVDSAYNYWCAHKRLAVIPEIYAGHSARAYNKLKSAITDKMINVQKKYVHTYQIENWVHIFACSNSKRALKLSDDDRRWFCPAIVEYRRDNEYWTRFQTWLKLEGGYGIIKHWASTFLESNQPVNSAASAPWSTLKAEIIEEGYSPGEALVVKILKSISDTIRLAEQAAQIPLHELSQELKDAQSIVQQWERERRCTHNKEVFLLDCDLIRAIKTHIHNGHHSPLLEKPLTVRKVARSCGWHISEKKISRRGWNAAFAYIISNTEYFTTTMDPAAIYQQPINPMDATVWQF